MAFKGKRTAGTGIKSGATVREHKAVGFTLESADENTEEFRCYFKELGKTDAYLFVSDYAEEWETDRQSINHPEDGLFAYVYNHEAPWCSEMGDIGVARTVAAGLQRTW